MLLSSHGQAATTRAQKRTIDSLEKTGLDWQGTSKLVDDGPGPNIEVSEEACGELPVPNVPDNLDSEPTPTRR